MHGKVERKAQAEHTIITKCLFGATRIKKFRLTNLKKIKTAVILHGGLCRICTVNQKKPFRSVLIAQDRGQMNHGSCNVPYWRKPFSDICPQYILSSFWCPDYCTLTHVFAWGFSVWLSLCLTDCLGPHVSSSGVAYLELAYTISCDWVHSGPGPSWAQAIFP